MNLPKFGSEGDTLPEEETRQFGLLQPRQTAGDTFSKGMLMTTSRILLLAAAAWIAVPVAAQVPIPEGTEIAEDYFRISAWLWLVEQAVVLALGCFLLGSGLGAAIASRVERVSGNRWAVAVAGFAGLYAVLYLIAKLPIDYWQMVKLNPYFGLPTFGVVSWLAQQAVPGVQLAILAGVGGLATLWLIRSSPRGWWAWASGAIIAFTVGNLALNPVLNYSDSEKYVPIDSSEYADWRPRLDALLSRVDTMDVPIEVWRTTEQDFCRLSNSVVGLGPTRKIILADQIFSEWDDAQIEAAFAHELKHYLLDNTWVPVAIISVIAVAGCLFVYVGGNYVCRRWNKRVGFSSLAVPAAIPLLAVLLQIYMLVATPAFNLTAQQVELAADRFALELTRNNDARARVSADKCGLWLPEDTLYARLYLFTHPSLARRLRLANEYRPWETGEPLAYENLINFP
jgi:Zn-dependent protease with chaperone function